MDLSLPIINKELEGQSISQCILRNVALVSLQHSTSLETLSVKE